jgi:hypothetical protein
VSVVTSFCNSFIQVPADKGDLIADDAEQKSSLKLRQDNQPKELFSPAFTVQKLNYLHNNPVEAGIVDRPEDYVYSSARDYKARKNCGLVKIFFL